MEENTTLGLPPGRVVTFYSYKGGVGRTFALVDVAILLARWGWRMLVVDWDLEAPGIDTYLRPWLPEPRVEGTLEFLESVGEGTPSHPRPVWVPAPGTFDRLWAVSAGADRPDYTDRVQRLDWNALYDRGLFQAVEALRASWSATFDLVLIDSRTGTNDIGAICAVQLPDVLVALFTPNRQSYPGARAVMERAVQRQAELPLDRSPLRVVSVLSRIDNSEYRDRLAWTARVSEELLPFLQAWEPGGRVDGRVVEHLAVPHVGYFSYDERLAVDVEQRGAPGTVAYAHANLAGLIVNNLQRSESLLTERARYVPESGKALGAIGRYGGSAPIDALQRRDAQSYGGIHPKHDADCGLVIDATASLRALRDILVGPLFLVSTTGAAIDPGVVDLHPGEFIEIRGPFRSDDQLVSRVILGH